MKKTPTIFERAPSGIVIPVHNRECDWVFDEPWSSISVCRKWNGTCCMVQDNMLYKRRMIKPGFAVPAGWIAVEEVFNDDGGLNSVIGWVPVDEEDPADQWHMEAWEQNDINGTFELCGPMINGNPDGFEKHVLLEHALAPQISTEFPRDYEGFQAVLAGVAGWEGLVIRHQDGRMGKIKHKDFGNANRRMHS